MSLVDLYMHYSISNDIVNIPVVVRSPFPTRITSVDMVFTWDNTKLQLIGLDNTGTLANTNMSFFPGCCSWDYYGMNEVVPPQDGNGLYFWLAPLTGVPVMVSNEALLTTFKFRKLTNFTSTTVDIIPQFTVTWPADTIIYGSGGNITGTIHGVTISLGDLDQNGAVGASDLALFLAEWGTINPSPCDLNNDGIVNGGDLGLLLTNWS
jgi:hypothetical protein